LKTPEKMKAKLFLLVIITINFIVTAQNPEVCTENITLMATSVKAKDASAYDYLTALRKECPSFHRGIYTYGEFAIKQKIETAPNAIEKEKYLQDLLKLYDEYFKYFPQDGAGVDMKKGLALFSYTPEKKDEIYSFLDTAFQKDNANFNSTRGLYAYFEIFVNDYKLEKKGITLQQVFDKYDDISEKLAQQEKIESEAIDELLAKEEAGKQLDSKEAKAKAKIESNLEDINTVTGSMDVIIIELSSCEKLIPFYQKGFEENKNNEVWLKRAADRLESKECDTNPLFSKISEALYKLNPNADAAYKLGVVELQRKNNTKAMDYFNQAADLYKDNSKKALVYMKIASTYMNSNKSQARAYARKALQVKPSYGRAYLLIAQLYQNSINECGNNPFDKRAMYWLAAQYAEKAASVDASLKETAGKMAASYRAAAPSRTEIFQSGKQGQRIAFDCWIGESVVVPTL